MKTLRELTETVRAGRPLEIELGDFLDGFYLAPEVAKVQERPPALAGAHLKPDRVLLLHSEVVAEISNQ